MSWSIAAAAFSILLVLGICGTVALKVSDMVTDRWGMRAGFSCWMLAVIIFISLVVGAISHVVGAIPERAQCVETQ